MNIDNNQPEFSGEAFPFGKKGGAENPGLLSEKTEKQLVISGIIIKI